jgi:hypothetical protein
MGKYLALPVANCSAVTPAIAYNQWRLMKLPSGRRVNSIGTSIQTNSTAV